MTPDVSEPSARRALIAVVDDDDSFREPLEELLRSLDFDVEAFESGEAFLARARRPPLDCVLVDATLPGVSGAELGRQLAERGSHTPVIFLTGYEGAEVRKMLGPDTSYLSKPFEEEDLLSALETALNPL